MNKLVQRFLTALKYIGIVLFVIYIWLVITYYNDPMWKQNVDPSFIERVFEAMSEALFVSLANIIMFPYVVTGTSIGTP